MKKSVENDGQTNIKKKYSPIAKKHVCRHCLQSLSITRLFSIINPVHHYKNYTNINLVNKIKNI